MIATTSPSWVADAMATAALPGAPDPSGWLRALAWEVRRGGLAYHAIDAVDSDQMPHLATMRRTFHDTPEGVDATFAWSSIAP